MIKTLFIAIATIAVVSPVAHGAIVVSTANVAVTENFNSLGTASAATLPSDWKFSPYATSSPTWSSASNLTATNGKFDADNNATTTAHGRTNFGAGNPVTTDRAAGLFTGSSTSNFSLMANYRNTTGSSISEVDVAYDWELYRQQNGNGSVNLQFFYSTNGSTWSAVTAGNHTFSGTGTGTEAKGYPLTTINESFTINLPAPLANNADLYLRWYNPNAGALGAFGIGVDNVSVTLVPEPAALAPAALAGLMLVARRRRDI